MNITATNNVGFNGVYNACINNQFGLHLRPSGIIAKLTNLTEKPIYMSTNGCSPRNVRGSVMSILTLEPSHGKNIKIEVPDDYPKDLLKTILGCINANSDDEIKTIFEAYKALGNKVDVLA